MKVFGIDLGTTYSAISQINEFGQPEIIQNADGASTTPSVVLFEDDQTYVVGNEAKNELKLRPDESVELIKRHMGDRYPVNIHGVEHSPESISAFILKQLVEDAQEYTGEDSNAVVITVPAYFGVEAKKATEDAGIIAGLDVRALLTEPVAAALSAGMKYHSNKTLFTYDLGGGTFDCTVMEVTDETIEVLAVDGDRSLGGADWDQALYDLAVMNFVLATGLDEDPNYDDHFVQNLRSEVEKAKISLSRKKSAKIPCNYENTHTAIVEITREDFEQATKHLVDQTLRVVDRTLAAAKEKRPNLSIDHYLLVGGSSRMPMISNALHDKYGWELTPTEYDLAVAKGAAIYGQGLADAKRGAPNTESRQDTGESNDGRIVVATAGGERKVEIQDVLPKAIGVRFWDPVQQADYVSHILKAGTKLPASAKARGLAAQDDTTKLTFEIYEQAGEVPSPDLAANKSITPNGGATLTNLPNLQKGSPVDLELRVSRDGIITLSGHEPTTDQRFELAAQISTLSDVERDRYKGMIQGMLPSE